MALLNISRNRNFVFLPFLLLCTILSVSEVFAVNYFVSVDGNDANAGSQNSPFRTIQRGIQAAQPGDQVLVSAGDYIEDISTVRNGTSLSPIVIDGQGLAKIRQANFRHTYNTIQGFQIAGKNMEYQAAVWFWTNAHYSVLKNCTIDNGLISDFIGIGWKTGPNKPFDASSASHCQVLNNTVANVANTSMLSIAGEDNLIEGNLVKDGAKVDFIRIWGKNNIVRKNTFKNNYTTPLYSNHPDFVQTFGNGGYGSTGHIFEGNLIDGIQAGQLSQLEGNLVPEIGDWTFRNNIFMNIALGASCTIPNIKYYNNIFYRCNTGNGSHPLVFGSRAYEARTVDPSTAAYSLIANPVNSGELIEGAIYTVIVPTVESGQILPGKEYLVGGGNSDYVTYEGVQYKRNQIFVGTSASTYTKSTNNALVYLNGRITYNNVDYYFDQEFVANSTKTFVVSYEGTKVWRRMYNVADGAQVINNIFLENADARTTRGWYGIDLNLKNVVADYNYVAKANFSQVTLDPQRRVVGGAISWDGLSWYEPNGINGGDPHFVDLPNLNFDILADSLLIDRAKILSVVPTDRNGNARPVGISSDIGAYEYGGIAPVRPHSPANLRLR